MILVDDRLDTDKRPVRPPGDGNAAAARADHHHPLPDQKPDHLDLQNPLRSRGGDHPPPAVAILSHRPAAL